MHCGSTLLGVAPYKIPSRVFYEYWPKKEDEDEDEDEYEDEIKVIDALNCSEECLIIPDEMNKLCYSAIWACAQLIHSVSQNERSLNL